MTAMCVSLQLGTGKQKICLSPKQTEVSIYSFFIAPKFIVGIIKVEYLN